MKQLMTKRSKKLGLPPGTLVHVGKQRTARVKMMLFDYDQEHFEEKEVHSIDEVVAYRDKPSVTWLNIDGVHNVKLLEELGSHFKIHSLVLEDILNTGQRPKIEAYDGYMFIVLKMLTYDEKQNTFEKENLSIVFGEKFVFSFQEKEGDIFDAIRLRIRNDESRLRKTGTDYLVYRILDTIVDHYFVVLEHYGERIEQLELEVSEEPSRETLHEIHKLKRELLLLRKPVWPLREVINGLQKDESSLIVEPTHLFLRDVYDHTIQVTDNIDNFREIVSGLLDIYLSSVSNRMNEVMKVLTVIATIFIPLTFIAGIYGMNFKFMPELEWRWGYGGVWIVILVIGIIMLGFFKKRNWL